MRRRAQDVHQEDTLVLHRQPLMREALHQHPVQGARSGGHDRHGLQGPATVICRQVGGQPCVGGVHAPVRSRYESCRSRCPRRPPATQRSCRCLQLYLRPERGAAPRNITMVWARSRGTQQRVGRDTSTRAWSTGSTWQEWVETRPLTKSLYTRATSTASNIQRQAILQLWKLRSVCHGRASTAFISSGKRSVSKATRLSKTNLSGMSFREACVRV